VVQLLPDEIKNLRGTFGVYMCLRKKEKTHSFISTWKKIKSGAGVRA